MVILSGLDSFVINVKLKHVTSLLSAHISPVTSSSSSSSPFLSPTKQHQCSMTKEFVLPPVVFASYDKRLGLPGQRGTTAKPLAF
ncbi:hypothetical protein Taro_054640 [Colocasia esculenta]|uniref:Uncharacterized protein n=1 Tax=Colocasia esculenta TaxID=4460 RepID=A0A843XP24_COLES|nr:hypothetical protein [Colocasia esculenta]